MAVLLAEHRLERCLSAADRVVALAAGAIAFDGAPRGYCEWALVARPEVGAPGGAVVLARRAGAGAGGGEGGAARLGGFAARGSPAARRAGRSRALEAAGRARAGALDVRKLWVELDPGDRAAARCCAGSTSRSSPARSSRSWAVTAPARAPCCVSLPGCVEPGRGAVETPRGCALLPQSPTDLLVRERVADELPGEAGRRALAAVGLELRGRRRPARPLGRRARAARARNRDGGPGRRRAAGAGLPGRADPWDGPRAQGSSSCDWLGELAGARGRRAGRNPRRRVRRPPRRPGGAARRRAS